MGKDSWDRKACTGSRDRTAGADSQTGTGRRGKRGNSSQNMTAWAAQLEHENGDETTMAGQHYSTVGTDMYIWDMTTGVR